MESMPPLTARRIPDRVGNDEASVRNDAGEVGNDEGEVGNDEGEVRNDAGEVGIKGEADRESAISPLNSSTVCLKRSSITSYWRWSM